MLTGHLLCARCYNAFGYTAKYAIVHALRELKSGRSPAVCQPSVGECLLPGGKALRVYSR